jgi:ATP phosphoribosyltransferase regulatory subunit
VVRIAGDQLDPRRENLQLGAELIGSDTVAAAAEVVEIAIASLEAAGATGISVDFTLPDLVDTLAAEEFPLSAEQMAAVREELDAKDAGALCEAGGAAYLPLLYASGPFDEAIEKLALIDARGALASRIAGLRQIAARVAGRARLTLDPVRTPTGFVVPDPGLGVTLLCRRVGRARHARGRGGTPIGLHGTRGSRDRTFSLYPEGPGRGGQGRRVRGAKAVILPPLFTIPQTVCPISVARAPQAGPWRAWSRRG